MRESNEIWDSWDYNEIGMRFADEINLIAHEIFGEKPFDVNRALATFQIASFAFIGSVIKGSELSEKDTIFLAERVKARNAEMAEELMRLVSGK